MARKPNYRFERHERERIKAAKKAARLAAKQERPPQGCREASRAFRAARGVRPAVSSIGSSALRVVVTPAHSCT